MNYFSFLSSKLRRAEARRVLFPANGLPRTAAKTTPIHPPAESKQGPRQGVPKSRARGFVIATDAFFSLLILFAIITVSFEVMKNNGHDLADRQSLSVFADYAGRSLEQSGILKRAVILNSTTEIRTYLNGWPASRCGMVSLYASPDTNDASLVITKPGCTYVSGIQESVRRGFVVPTPPDANLYVASIAVWVNQ